MCKQNNVTTLQKPQFKVVCTCLKSAWLDTALKIRCFIEVRKFPTPRRHLLGSNLSLKHIIFKHFSRGLQGFGVSLLLSEFLGQHPCTFQTTACTLLCGNGESTQFCSFPTDKSAPPTPQKIPITLFHGIKVSSVP